MLKGILTISIYKIFGACSMLATNIIVSQYYGPELLGVFNLILALLMIGLTLSKVGLDIYVLKIISALSSDSEKQANFIKRIAQILFLSSSLVFLLIFLSQNVINEHIFSSFDASSYILGAMVTVIPLTYLGVLPEVFRGFGDLKIYSLYRSVLQNLFILTLIGLGIALGNPFDPIYTIYLAIFITAGLTVINLNFFLKQKEVNIWKSGRYSSPVLKYSYPMMLTSSMMVLMSYADILMISYYMAEYQVGIYVACVTIASGIIFLQNSVNVYVAPNIARLYSLGDYKKIKEQYYNSTKLSFSFSLLAFVVINIYPNFFLNLFGKEFLNIDTALMVITASFLLNSMCGPATYTLNMTGNQKVVMKITIFALVINIFSNVLLIPLFGIVGAAYSTFISMGCQNLVGFYFVYRKLFAS